MFSHSGEPTLNEARDNYTEDEEVVCGYCEAIGDTLVRTVNEYSGRRTRTWLCPDCGADNEVVYGWVTDYEGSRHEVI